MTPRTRSVVVGLTLEAALVVALDLPAALRVPTVLLFAFVAPGLALTASVPGLSRVERASLAGAVSLVVMVGASFVLVALDIWSTSTTFYLVAGLTLAASLRDLRLSPLPPIALNGSWDAQAGPRPSSFEAFKRMSTETAAAPSWSSPTLHAEVHLTSDQIVVCIATRRGWVFHHRGRRRRRVSTMSFEELKSFVGYDVSPLAEVLDGVGPNGEFGWASAAVSWRIHLADRNVRPSLVEMLEARSDTGDRAVQGPTIADVPRWRNVLLPNRPGSDAPRGVVDERWIKYTGVS